MLSPGVLVEEGAIVRDSIVLSTPPSAPARRRPRDRRQGGRDRAERATSATATTWRPTATEPERLNTGITLVGKRAQVPYGVRMGRNCRIDPDVDATDFKLADLPSGTTVTHRHTEQ